MTNKLFFNFLTTLAVLMQAGLSVADEQSAWQLSGYAEGYYLHDFNDSSLEKRPSFTYSHNTSHTPSINLALIKASFHQPNFRANLALGGGTYMRANYAAEAKSLQKIFEANVGVKLSNQHNLWLDVGVMPSHIGFESAIGADNWTVSRSLMADNSPYFETGARVSYTSEDGQWYVSGLLLNGWQRIQRPDDNTTPAIGHQLTYKPNSKVTLNSSSFIGNDKSDRERKMRYFHNAYGQFQLNDQWSLIAGLDVGAEQAEHNSQRYHTWFTPIIIMRYAFSDRLAIAGRAEYYQDRHGVIIDTGTPNGFNTAAYSINLDFNVTPNAMLRTELRSYHSQDKLFAKDDAMRANSLIAVTAMTIRF
jgi:Putative beta-barrel porin-2, OmpL-like. bbp2